MTQITVQNGKIITENNKIGTEQGCCCSGVSCETAYVSTCGVNSCFYLTSAETEQEAAQFAQQWIAQAQATYDPILECLRNNGFINVSADYDFWTYNINEICPGLLDPSDTFVWTFTVAAVFRSECCGEWLTTPSVKCYAPLGPISLIGGACIFDSPDEDENGTFYLLSECNQNPLP